ncbi:MAG: methyltransferase domain-containing protein, partial [Phycisphaerae bacterium]|nr:methyltransferase domain-containing protein [Phycisphaerae bacterium]
VKASEYRFPYEDNIFDFVFLTSVFTHMLPEDMFNYIKEITRVMKKNAKCIITYFILNKESLLLISNNKTNFRFMQYSENIYVMNNKDPEAAIGFTEKYIEQMYYNNNLEIKEIRYGNWCGRDSKLLGQDLVYAVKQEF